MQRAFERRTITSELARAMVDAAEDKARDLGLAIATVVVDDSGVLKTYSRMDGAPLIAEGASFKKARTAVGFGMATGQPWHDFIKEDPILMHGAPQLDDFILLGGGQPILYEGTMIGAIGVSGGHYHQDEACACAATALVEAVPA
ncbi:MAG: heme-binding protein [Myxococcales bacterium]|nr:heme-binding protein [Myxococcales bacterium]